MKKLIGIKKKNQRGYTLLEYCAGAAVIAGVVYAALFALGESFNAYLTKLSGFVTDRANMVPSGSGSNNGNSGDNGSNTGS